MAAISERTRERGRAAYAARYLTGSEPWKIVALAAMVGVGGGFGAVAFRKMISFFQEVYFVWLNRLLAPHFGHLSFIILPGLGGLVFGPIIYFFAKEAKGHGVPVVMEAVAAHQARMRPRLVFFTSLISSICIGSGGSAGREGPIVQIGSALGSTFAQILKLPVKLAKLLVGCGGAAGIAATFNAPLGGSFFALELIVRDWGATIFAPVVVSAFFATAVSRRFLGDHPSFLVPPYSVNSLSELPLFGLVGLACALVGTLFIVTLTFLEDFWDEVKIPEWLKPMPGGLIVGAMGVLSLHLLGTPTDYQQGIFGVGYPTLQRILSGSVDIPIILGSLMLLKVAATSMTLGSGGSGGIFAPSLFMGCMTGGFIGSLVHMWLPGLGTSPAAYALVGMGAVFTATSRAPITSVLVVYEITQDYRMILPLMFACAVSLVVARGLLRFSIYEIPLIRRGIHVSLVQEPVLLNDIHVDDAMSAPVITVRPDQTVAEVLHLFDTTKHHGFPVVDRQGRLHGLITLSDVREALTEGDLDAPVSHYATHDLLITFPDETLNDALRKLAMGDVGRLPVVATDDHQRLLGLITRKNILSAYNQALTSRHTRLEETVRPEHLP